LPIDKPVQAGKTHRATPPAARVAAARFFLRFTDIFDGRNMRARTVSRLLAIFASAFSISAMPADHAESPATDADTAADIADVFIFASPDATKLVGAITFGGRPAPRSRIDGSFYCDPDVLYTYNIDRADASGSFDNVADFKVLIRFGKNRAGQCGIQLESVPGTSQTISGPIELELPGSNGLRAFAGLRNDPFFFDFEGFSALLNTFATPGQHGDLVSSFRLGGGQPRRDSFAFRNVSAIVFEMNIDTVAPRSAGGTRPKVRVWATTSRFAG